VQTGKGEDITPHGLSQTSVSLPSQAVTLVNPHQSSQCHHHQEKNPSARWCTGLNSRAWKMEDTDSHEQ